jgi:hypothetical protein
MDSARGAREAAYLMEKCLLAPHCRERHRAAACELIHEIYIYAYSQTSEAKQIQNKSIFQKITACQKCTYERMQNKEKNLIKKY